MASSVPSRPRARRSSRAKNGPTGCSSGGGVSKVGEEALVTRPTRRRRPPRRPPRPRRRSAARVKRPLLAARAATLSRPCGHPPPRGPAPAQGSSPLGPSREESPRRLDAEAMQRQRRSLPVAGPTNAAYFAVPSTTQAAEAPPPVVLPPQPVGCAAAEAVGAAGAHGPHSSHNGPPRAVGRGASRVTDAYGARARAGCTWLGSLRLKITSIPISILYSSAVPLGSSRKISPLRSS